MAGQITTGVQAIAMGPIAVDGGMGTSLTTLGYTDADATNNFTQDDPTIQDFTALEVNDPIFRKKIDGAKNLRFTILDPDPDAMVRVLGGSVSGSAPNKTWSAPLVDAAIEQSVEITPDVGLTLSIVRGYVTAKINHDFSKTTGKLAVDVIVSILTPKKAGVAPFNYGPSA